MLRVAPPLRRLVTVLVLLVLWRSALFAVDFVGTSTTAERPYNRNANYRAFPGHYFLDGWARWDSGWYQRIASTDTPSRAGERGRLLSGLPVCGAFRRDALRKPLDRRSRRLERLSGRRALLPPSARLALPRRGTACGSLGVLIASGSFFFSAYLSESMFLAAAVACTYYYMRRKFLAAGNFGLWATLTRSWDDAVRRLAWTMSSPRLAALGDLLARRPLPAPDPARNPLFMLVLYVQVGNPLALFEYQGLRGADDDLPARAAPGRSRARIAASAYLGLQQRAFRKRS
jgi:hypothetical protein